MNLSLLGMRRARRRSTKPLHFYVNFSVAHATPRGSTPYGKKYISIEIGYYPLVPGECQRLRRHLDFPPECAVLDPCAGTGTALQQITGDTRACRYGVELDSFRAAQARRSLDEVIQGSVFDTHCPVEAYSLLYLNPPLS